MNDVMNDTMNGMCSDRKVHLVIQDGFCLALVVSKIHLNSLNGALHTTDKTNFGIDCLFIDNISNEQ